MIIYHMLPILIWQQQMEGVPYECDTLETEGFMHCTDERERLLWVANQFYSNQAGEYVILYIDEKEVHADLRWEEADGHLFPHIYGALNLDAVTEVIDFPRDSAGKFTMPPQWL